MDLNGLLNRPAEGLLAEHWQAADFARATWLLAARLHAAEINSVALWFDDAARFASALLAAWQAGAEVYLPPDLSPESRQWASDKGCVWLSDCAGVCADEWCYAHDDVWQNADASEPAFALQPGSRVLLKTSGSGGAAKTVVKTLAQMQTEAAALAACLPAGWRGAYAWSSVSQQHLYGLSFRIFTALAAGWIIGRRQCRYPEELIAASKTRGIWITSPAVLNRLGAERNWAVLRQNLSGMVSAGGMLPENVANMLAEHWGHYPHDVYGSTETGVAALRVGTGHWQLLPEVAARADGDGLCIQSPWTDGEVLSADTGEVKGRSLALHGRSDRIVKLEDKRVSLNRLEHALLAHDWIDDAYCALHPQYRRVAVWAALSAAGKQAFRQHGRAAVIAVLKERLAVFADAVALPRYWRFASSLPRNAQAKIRRQDFEEALLHPALCPDWVQQHSDAADEYCFIGRVPLDLPYFSGHFADFPLVPGVVEMQWALDVAARFDWGRGVPVRVENLKYQHFVRPDDEICLLLRYDVGMGKLHFSIKCADKVCASGRVVWA